MTILQSLDRYYGRMAARSDVVAPGWSVEPIGSVIVLAPDGSVRDVIAWRDPSGKKPRPERMPKWFGRQGTGSTPFFLWDNTAYALGVSDKEPKKTARDHAAFRVLHANALAETNDEGLRALRRFVERWTPDQFVAPPFEPWMLKVSLAFQLEGERRLLHERPAAADLVDTLRGRVGEGKKQSTVGEATCLVRGKILPIARLHTKIKGVDGTASAEVPLVSFQGDSFQSYGNEQGENAPTSTEAASSYAAALNRLLDRGTSRNRLKIADATVVFWADIREEAGIGEEAATAAEETFALFVDPPVRSKADKDEAERTRALQDAVKLETELEKVAKGRPVQELDPRLRPDTRFYVLGLAPNAARLSVRLWLSDTLDTFLRHLGRHYDDLRVEPSPRGWTTPPAVQRLLVRTTALQEKFDNIPPLLAGEVTRAVLTGSPYPRTLLAAAIIRLRAGDDPGSGWHAAVIKACLNRSAKEKAPVALEPDNKSTAYQLGRLFYVLESAQRAALGRVNATIADRYYGAASATPARVFGPLLRGLRNHVSDARKRGQGGWIEPKVAEIMSKLPPNLPPTLRLEDQGRFAIGYYHERGTRPAKDSDADDTEGETVQ